MNKPQVVLADEPTGNLDGKAAESIYQLMLELNQEMGTAFIVVTHDLQLAEQLQRVEVLKMEFCIRSKANAACTVNCPTLS